MFIAGTHLPIVGSSFRLHSLVAQHSHLFSSFAHRLLPPEVRIWDVSDKVHLLDVLQQPRVHHSGRQPGLAQQARIPVR